MTSQRKDKSQVWVWTEQDKGEPARVSLGLLGKARQLCQQSGGGEVASVLAGTDSRPLAERLINHGADRVYLADGSPHLPFDTELCARFMARLIQTHQPEIVLWGATSLGREVASRTAARLETGLTAHCIDLFIEKIEDKNQLVAVVAGWGGNLTIKIICPHKRPQMATVKAGIFIPPQPAKRSGEVIPVKITDESSLIEIIEVVEEEKKASLEEAEIVVVGGWGLNSLSGFREVEELTRVLGGSVGGTRPALDAGWIPTERMIGQSGTTVAPKLLITLGVSGAPQFASGVLNSKIILAVDKNPSAPIFEMADIGIVGELKDVLPLLTQKLRALKKKA